MQHQNSVTDNRTDTDALFDTSPAAMAARFGEKALRLSRKGQYVAGTVRLAASYAFLARPDLRETSTYSANIFALGRSLACATVRSVN